MRITAACPAALVGDANNLAMVLAFGPEDASTYVGLNWQDAQGNLYAAASWEARPEWIEAATQPLTRPAWDTEQIIDMDAAARAQAALVFWWPSEDASAPPAASPTALTAIAGMSGPDALAAMGLVPAPPADLADR